MRDAVLVEDPVTVRVTPVSALVIVLASLFWAVVLVGVPVVVIARSNHALVWATIVGVAVVFAGNGLRSRASFSATGLDARSAFRCYTVRWDEVRAVRVVPAPWNCAEFGWAANVMEIETKEGRRFPVRATTHLSRAMAERLGGFVATCAVEYGFESPGSFLALWKLSAV